MNDEKFLDGLSLLLVLHGIDVKAETEAYILAGFLDGCLRSYITATKERDES